jgi:uncharacterized protein involved in exopolysaccharide biosynthesis
MLTGELPSSKLEPPSSRLRGMHLDVRLDEIVLRALHAQPELRYRTALDLKTQLELVTVEPSAANVSATPAPDPAIVPRSSKRPENASADLSEAKTSSANPRLGSRRRMARLGLFLLITLGGVIATSLLLPRQYFAKVTMELPPDKESRLRPWLADRLHAEFLATQFQVLRRPEILGPVVEEFDLAKTLSKGRQLSAAELSARLARSLELREIRNTGLLELGVYNRDPALAARIANTIAKGYQNKRLTDFQMSVDSRLRQLTDQVETQRKRVAESKAEVEKIRVNDQIIDPEPESFNSGLGKTADRNILDLEKQINEKESIVANLKIQLEQISKLKPEQMKEVMWILRIDDPQMEKLVASLNEARTEEARLLPTIGEKHRKILGLRAQIAVFSRQLAESLSTVQQNRARLLESEQGILATLQERFKEAKAFEIDDRKKLAPYIDAKSRYLQDKKVFEAAQIKFSTERFDLGIDFEPVRIWERAEPSLYPVWPSFRRLWQAILP